ncbi:interleukin-1 beta [Megalops cyprinoides]|uniref:interleukin-1 beta n=1 Tax=Megalops cyprinoides TaxID=118141 RepID=UPI0018654558|nr:interleukin-1 beta [Megalops cyprinoides]
MMCDASFDLSLALDRTYMPDTIEVEAGCHHAVKKGSLSRGQSCDLHAGLELEVFSQPQSMRHAANLIIALQRMKSGHRLTGTEFSDHELLNIMMESIMEEHVTVRVQDPTYSRTSMFRRSTINPEVECSVCDQYQKSLVLNEDALELTAMTLQAAGIHHKVRLNLSSYMAHPLSGNRGQPVALAIAGRNLYLSCAMKEGVPVLQLEEVNNKEKLDTINAEGDTARFLFFKRGNGLSMTTFESAKFSGWFISTGVEEREPVEMCTMQAADRLTSFMVKQ